VALLNVSFDAVSEAHLQDLVSTGVPEGVFLEYKRTTYGNGDADVKEYLKDVSSFANTHGGDLVIGIEEKGGLATKVLGVAGVNPDTELQRLESLARDGIEPRIVGLQMKAVSVTGGGIVFVIRVPRSWNPPHRVSARKTNRIYARNSTGAYELGVEELRVLFASGATTVDRMRAFKAERLARIDAGEAIVPLIVRPDRLVLHLVPLASFGLSEPIDLAQAHALQDSLRPIGSMGYSPRINFEGFATFFMGSDGLCRSYTQVFRNGIIEAVKVPLLGNSDGDVLILPSLAFDKWIFEVLPLYLKALRELNVPAPITMMLSLQGVRGAFLVTHANWHINPPPPFDRAVLELPEVVIEQYGTFEAYQRTVRPAFDALWNAGGFFASKHFDADGRWVGLPR
jgi:Putative DNA-binding domain